MATLLKSTLQPMCMLYGHYSKCAMRGNQVNRTCKGQHFGGARTTTFLVPSSLCHPLAALTPIRAFMLTWDER